MNCYDCYNDDDWAEERRQEKESELKAIKKLDKNYEKFKVELNGNLITIENYGSGSHGTWIRNAVTSSKYNIKVGSKDEDILFKVSDTSRNRKDPLLLYYDTPEQFENHHLTRVSQQVKSNWNKKSLEAERRILKNIKK